MYKGCPHGNHINTYCSGLTLYKAPQSNCVLCLLRLSDTFTSVCNYIVVNGVCKCKSGAVETVLVRVLEIERGFQMHQGELRLTVYQIVHMYVLILFYCWYLAGMGGQVPHISPMAHISILGVYCADVYCPGILS